MTINGSSYEKRAVLIELNHFFGKKGVASPDGILSAILQENPNIGAIQPEAGGNEIDAMFWSNLFQRWFFTIEGNLYASIPGEERDFSVVNWLESVVLSVGDVYDSPKKNQILSKELCLCLGKLAGNKRANFAEFGSVLCVASGGLLQVWDGAMLHTVGAKRPKSEEALLMDVVMVRGNRLVGAQVGAQHVYYSPPQDPYDWTWDDGSTIMESVENVSLAHYHEVRYLDSKEVIGLSSIPRDYIVYCKDLSGKPVLFRVDGQFDRKDGWVFKKP